MAPTQLFLSCVSAEFSLYRDSLRHNLDLPDVAVKIQEDFIAGGVSTLDKLDTYIKACDAVIHLVGDGLGSIAKPRSLEYLRRTYPNLTERFPVLAPFLVDNSGGLSYTQWEAWLALLHGKKLLICVPGVGVPRMEGFHILEEEQGLQKAHLDRLRRLEAYPEVEFLNIDQLTVEILRALYRELRLPGSQFAKPRNDWSWPKVWDFATYRAEKRKGFMGREWLVNELRIWATNPDSEQALLICADYGVGKSAFLAQLLESGEAGLPLAAEHFCTTEQSATLSPALFVRNLAAQLAKAVPAYRQALEADEAKDLRHFLDEANIDPTRAFEQSVLSPLASLQPPPEPQLLVVDALDEAQDPASSAAQSGALTIVQLLTRYAKRIPRWLKILATSRRRPDVVKPLMQSFTMKEIDAEDARNLADLFSYAEARCNRYPLVNRLSHARLTPSEVADFLSSQKQSSGKFLYLACVLNDLESGLLPLENRADLEALPPGLDGFYAEAFQRRFPSEEAYASVEPVLAVLADAMEPLGRRELAHIMSCTESEIIGSLNPLRDLLRLRPTEVERDGRVYKEILYSFDHLSLEQWLSENDEDELLPRAGRFSLDRGIGAHRLRSWALVEVETGRAFSWPYLVRNLASHLKDQELHKIIARLLWDLPWLEARLRLAGINALLGDFTLGGSNRSLEILRTALRQAAHILDSNHLGWRGSNQLASQLLARLTDNVNNADVASLREQAKAWLLSKDSAYPVKVSFLANKKLKRTLHAGGAVRALAALSDGRIAVGLHGGDIRIFDPTSESFILDVPGHKELKSLLAVSKGCFVSLDYDHNLQLWDPSSSSSIAFLAADDCQFLSPTLTRDGRLVIRSVDGSIRLWDPSSQNYAEDLQVNESDYISDLIVLGDGRITSFKSGISAGTHHIELRDLASGSCTIIISGNHSTNLFLGLMRDGSLASTSVLGPTLLWDPTTGKCTAELSEDHVSCLAEMSDGRIACGTDDGTILVRDSINGSCTTELKAHQGAVSGLVALDSCHLVSGSYDETIRLWDLAARSGSEPIECHEKEIKGFAILHDGTIASGAGDLTIRLWDPALIRCTSVIKVPLGGVESIAVVSDGRIAIGCFDGTFRLWDPASGKCTTAPTRHQGPITSLLAVKGNRIITYGSFDKTIRVWNLSTDMISADMIPGSVSDCELGSVRAMQVLPDGSLATATGSTITLWDPATGECIRVFEGHDGDVNTLALLRDGRIASGSSDKTIRLWDTDTGDFTKAFTGHESDVKTLAVLGDGRLVSGSSDKTIRLWDPLDQDVYSNPLFVADAGITALTTHTAYPLLVAGDSSGGLYWLVNDKWLLNSKKGLALARLFQCFASGCRFIGEVANGYSKYLEEQWMRNE